MNKLHPALKPKSSESIDLKRLSTLHLCLAAVSMLIFLPYVWMILTSLKPVSEVENSNWIPSTVEWSNYIKTFSVMPFGRYYLNSIFVASWVTFVQVITSALAAFSFARLDWPGRDRVFLLYLVTIMLPGVVMVIPNYELMVRLKLVDSYLGLIVPASFSAFGTFLLRQFMLAIPRALDDAARMDGANDMQLFLQIILPLTKPGLITLTIFTFMSNYNSFFWPLIVVKSQEKMPLPLGLLSFEAQNTQSTHLLMAAIAMSVIPIMVAFILLQKQFVKGLIAGAVKG